MGNKDFGELINEWILRWFEEVFIIYSSLSLENCKKMMLNKIVDRYYLKFKFLVKRRFKILEKPLKF